MSGLQLAKNYWPKRSSSHGSATPLPPNAASFPGSKSKRTMSSIRRAARKPSPTSSTAKASLIVYHFMFGPEWQEGCPSCSLNMDHTDGALVHLGQRDVSFAAVSRAPISKIEPFKKRMGWNFNWLSSYNGDFNYDYQASFTPEQMAAGKVEYNFDLVQFPSAEAPGVSVFYRDNAGNIFHTYSAYARGSENTINTYNYLDLVSKGRDEENLEFTMAWLRHHDRYETGYLADPDRPYWPKAAV